MAVSRVYQGRHSIYDNDILQRCDNNIQLSMNQPDTTSTENYAMCY